VEINVVVGFDNERVAFLDGNGIVAPGHGDDGLGDFGIGLGGAAVFRKRAADHLVVEPEFDGGTTVV